MMNAKLITRITEGLMIFSLVACSHNQKLAKQTDIPHPSENRLAVNLVEQDDTTFQPTTEFQHTIGVYQSKTEGKSYWSNNTDGVQQKNVALNRLIKATNQQPKIPVNTPVLTNVPIRDVTPSTRKAIVQFAFNKSDLTPESIAALEQAIKPVGSEVSNINVVMVTGHTDNIGTMKYNQELSKRRADVVLDYLFERGVDKSRVAVSGEGFSNPIASNDDEDGRSKNRRAEVVISSSGVAN
jgi:outer membrane protein OmpA-like peptidoglycan-associated protein